MTHRRDGIGRFHPAAILSTWFGAGLLPKAPGTWGSIAALPFAWAMALAWGPLVLVAASLLCFAIGCWSASVYVTRTGIDDPGEVVIDEVAGQWLVLAAAPVDPLCYLVGLALFRLFDIWKPWPIRWMDRTIGGGFGVMADDMVAGLFGLPLMLAFARVWI